MRFFESLAIGVSMYSKIPMPRVEWNEKNMKYAMCFFPLVGVVTGILEVILGNVLLVYTSCGTLFFAGGMTLLPVLVNGGIHMDGFLDTQDALGSYQPRERRLEILKDSHAGAFAIISCAVYLMMYVAVYSALTSHAVVVIGFGFVLSRTLSGLSVITFPQARQKGLAATFSQNAARKATRSVLLLYLAGLIAAMLAAGGLAGAGALLGAGGMYLYYYRMSLKKFGGITGDLAGYFLQMCELIMAACVVLVEGVLR